MKAYKIIHMNEGHSRVLANGNWHFAEDFPWTEKMLNLHLQRGYTIKQMITSLSPGEPEGEGYSFYKDGFIFLLEHDTDQGEVTMEDWEEGNQLTKEDIAFLEERKACYERVDAANEFEKYLREALEEMDKEADEKEEECFFF